MLEPLGKKKTKNNLSGRAEGDGTKVIESPKRRFSQKTADLQIHPFSWKFKRLEGAGFSQKTARNRRLGSVTLGASPLARP